MVVFLVSYNFKRLTIFKGTLKVILDLIVHPKFYAGGVMQSTAKLINPSEIQVRFK